MRIALLRGQSIMHALGVHMPVALQRLCKVSAMKFTSIAELQPILCKDTAFKWNAHLKVYQKWFWFRSYCVLLREA